MTGYSLFYAEHKDYQTQIPVPQINLYEPPTPLKKTKQLKISPIPPWFSLPLALCLPPVSAKAVKYSLSQCFLTSQTPAISDLQPFPLTIAAMHCYTCAEIFKLSIYA